MLKKFPVTSFVVLTFAITWSVVLFSAATTITGKGEQVGFLALALVGQFGPSIAALIIMKSLYGRIGITSMLKSSVNVRQPIHLLLFAIFFFPALVTLAFSVSVLRGAPAPDITPDLLQAVALAFLPALVIGLIFGGLSEELGWRGFLLPRLQSKIGYMGAAIVIGFLWSAWHLYPETLALLWTDGWDAFWVKEQATLRIYLSETISACLIMAWLFNRSKGSIFLMIVLHSSSNACVASLGVLWSERPEVWSETITWFNWTAGALFLLLALRSPVEKLDAAQKRLGNDAES